MRCLFDISQMCTALISLTQQRGLGLVCAAGMLICSWKSRRCQPVGRQEIKQDFLLLHLHPCTHHSFKKKKFNILPPSTNSGCNAQICQLRRLQRGGRQRLIQAPCPRKSFWNILTGWRIEASKSRMNWNRVAPLFCVLLRIPGDAHHIKKWASQRFAPGSCAKAIKDFCLSLSWQLLFMN